ncbi:MAG: transposase [Lachnospiraceae bacterium]|nr:transposase [Lachnospiraceae bacterium]
MKLLYHARWSIEGAFRRLKYTIGLSSFHACGSEYIKQEIGAKLIAYNMTEMPINLSYTFLKQM